MKEIIIFILVVSFIGWLVIPGHGKNYSDGQRTGDIYKFSKKGLIVKSWEGEMYLGGYHSTGGKNPTIETDRFYFSVYGDNTSNVIQKLNECSEKRIQCTVKYNQWFMHPFSIDSSYVVTDVLINS